MEKNYPILAVEDDKITRALIVKQLEDNGFNVTSVADGKQALEQYDQSFYPILLTDWMMPEIDGLELCRLIRKKITSRYVYIILVTSRSSKLDIVSGLESGADDYVIKPIDPAELVARVRTGIRILELEKSLKIAHEDIKRLSKIDNLTECYNRNYLNEHLPRELYKAQRYQHPLSIVLVDIDHFKQVNDTYGHQIGDRVLRFFAVCIVEQIRYDIDWVVRYGGEEFLIVLPETPDSGARTVAERMRKAVENMAIPSEDTSIKITASFGGIGIDFKITPNVNISMKQIIQIADNNLYLSKENGRNQVHIASLKEA